jgi:hypothetical protein
MSFGVIGPEDLVCPNGHGRLVMSANQYMWFCTRCGFGVTGFEAEGNKHRNLRQMIADHAIGGYYHITAHPEESQQ